MQRNNGIELCFTRSQSVSLRLVQFIRPKVFNRIFVWGGCEFVECIGCVCLRYASVISWGKRYFSSVPHRRRLGPDATMSRVSAVNGNFMTSLTLITFIKLSCRTHVVECTFMCLLGNLDLLQCLSIALAQHCRRHPADIWASGFVASLSTVAWLGQCIAVRPSWSYLAITDRKYQWTELDVISNSNYGQPRVYCPIFTPNGFQSDRKMIRTILLNAKTMEKWRHRISGRWFFLDAGRYPVTITASSLNQRNNTRR